MRAVKNILTLSVPRPKDLAAGLTWQQDLRVEERIPGTAKCCLAIAGAYLFATAPEAGRIGLWEFW
jgi:hypothetical protein